MRGLCSSVSFCVGSAVKIQVNSFLEQTEQTYSLNFTYIFDTWSIETNLSIVMFLLSKPIFDVNTFHILWPMPPMPQTLILF